MSRAACMRRLAGLTVLAAAALLPACAVTQAMTDLTGPQPRPGSIDDEPPITRSAPRKGQAGGVFVSDGSWAITSDSRAFRPGDVVTVTLEETTQASKKADTKFGKGSSASVNPSVLLGSTFKSNIAVGAQRDFDGTSSSVQQNALQGAITVVVQEVLPNGLLRVKGEKNLFLNQGEEFVRVSGYVRAADIDAENRISSQRIANARIAYAGTGAAADANTAGWLVRFFNSPWMPF
jgi:flagellar L-ring protein precursor FlgH